MSVRLPAGSPNGAASTNSNTAHLFMRSNCSFRPARRAACFVTGGPAAWWRSTHCMRAGWNTVLLKIEPSLMVPTAFLFRIIGEDGETLNGIGYAADTSKILPPEQERIALTVDVPPGAVAWKDGKSMTCGTTVTLPAAPIPEHAVEFRSGTVSFPLESCTDSALAIDLGEVGVAAKVLLKGRKPGERV